MSNRGSALPAAAGGSISKASLFSVEHRRDKPLFYEHEGRYCTLSGGAGAGLANFAESMGEFNWTSASLVVA